jgi:hypothetical protein
VLPWWEFFLEYFDPKSEDKPDLGDVDYEEGQKLIGKKAARESKMRRQAEEILTEVYEEHIRPVAPKNYLLELLHNIPEYGEPSPAPVSSTEDIHEIALALVGLMPNHNNNVILFPAPNVRAVKDSGRKSPSRPAEVVSLAAWKSSVHICAG